MSKVRSMFLKFWLVALMFAVSSCELLNDSPSAETGEQQQQEYEQQSGSTGNVKLHYVYGGFNGSKAVEDPDVRIKGLKINGRSGMRYSWASGSGLKVWGLSYDEDGAVACIFYLDSDGAWKGGKFDWISTSRTTRDFKNLNSGYNGWNSSAFYASKKHGFCIVSKDGKKRSNFITD